MPAARVWTLVRMVLADGVEPPRESFTLALGEHVGEGPDVAGQGIGFGAVGQDGLGRSCSLSVSVSGRASLSTVPVAWKNSSQVTLLSVIEINRKPTRCHHQRPSPCRK
ncbi:hypothetical protein ACISU4_05020 [Streptomyces wuyuanensis]|uniref:hypothetical protein n=1 Tax=Streptomyces wuyuanensis TaxID=1196353 RepID=UPI0038004215